MPRPVIRGLFLHHSVGQQLLVEGRLRDRLAQADQVPDPILGDPPAAGPVLDLWDHDYNAIGFSDGLGNRLGRNLPVPGDDTDPPGLLRLFRGPDAGSAWVPGRGSFSDDADPARVHDQLREFDLILMKSCFPNNAIADETALAAVQAVYDQLFDVLGGWAGTSFVLLTSPPLTPRHTAADQAERAVRLARWLSGCAKPANVEVFDLFGVLAEEDGPQRGMLRRAYRRWRTDSHPNRRGSAAGAQALADYLTARAARP